MNLSELRVSWWCRRTVGIVLAKPVHYTHPTIQQLDGAVSVTNPCSVARLPEHVFLCGLKWCSYSASKCIFTEPRVLIGHGCSSSAAWRFLKESRAPGGGWMSEARKVFIPRQAPEQKLVSVPVCVGSLPLCPLCCCMSCVTSPHHPQHTWDVLSDSFKKS